MAAKSKFRVTNAEELLTNLYPYKLYRHTLYDFAQGAITLQTCTLIYRHTLYGFAQGAITLLCLEQSAQQMFLAHLGFM